MSPNPPEQGPLGTGRRIRWWPSWIILLLAAGGAGFVRFRPELSHQQQNLFTAAICAGALLLLTLWAFFFSRFHWRTRGLLIGVLGCAILGAFGLFRIRGVSGDLLPILEWRFHSRQRTAPPSAPSLSLTALSRATTPDSTPLASANDYPQFLGPDRNGVVDGPALARDWQAQPPELLWRQPIGPGWSGFAVRGRLAVTLEQREELEVVACYELQSGKQIWSHADSAHYHTTIAGEGPRTTPTIAGSRVFTMGATGLLNCLDFESGRLIWAKDVPRDNQGRVDDWGVSCSPLIVGDWVVVTTGAQDGRSLAAYQCETGARVWVAGDDRASYSSPALVTLAGTAQILILNSRSVASHDARSGSVLWQYPWPSGQPHVTTPIALPGDRVLVSSGYGVGSELLQIQHGANGDWTAQRVWKSIRLKSKFATLFCVGDYIYGLDDGIMVCVKASSGDLKWKDGRYGHGQMILRGDLLLVMAENGDVALVQPTPERHSELTRFHALRGKTWNPPALAGRNLLVRNDQEVACYTLPGLKTEGTADSK